MGVESCHLFNGEDSLRKKIIPSQEKMGAFSAHFFITLLILFKLADLLLSLIPAQPNC